MISKWTSWTDIDGNTIDDIEKDDATIIAEKVVESLPTPQAPKIPSGVPGVTDGLIKPLPKISIASSEDLRVASYKKYLTKFLEIANHEVARFHEERHPSVKHEKLEIRKGRVFDKIVNINEEGRVCSAWGFIRKTDGLHKGISVACGDIMMAATWKQPAKHPRGNIFNEHPWLGCGVYGPNYL